MQNKFFGIVGWKDSGKTTLAAGVLEALVSRGFSVSTIKHAHHAFDLDQLGTDSFKHRQAGAKEVMLVSSNRWALQHELTGEEEPSFEEMTAKMAPCDLVLVEGYKRERIPKIEVLSAENTEKPLWKTDDMVCAIATDGNLEDCPLPKFTRSQHIDIAEFILKNLGIPS